jgi:flavin reductase (DIM6/NTAB) family NADH-FMN oxidoreductase RutF
MHQFQPYPIELLEFNPFTEFGKEWAAIVSSGSKRPNAMTAAWGGVGVLWGKNVASIYVRDSRYTKELLDATDSFSINFFNNPKMKYTLEYLGQVSGRDEDKLAGARLHVDYEQGVPILDEAAFVFVCKKMAATRLTEDCFCDPSIRERWYSDGDFHTLYIGEILTVLAR